MEGLILPLLLSRLGRPQRSAVMERVLPAILPLGGQRVMFTALLAEQQVKRQVETDHLMVKEAVAAAGFTEREDLDSSPTLLKAFDNLPPALQEGVFPAPPSTEPTTRSAAPPGPPPASRPRDPQPCHTDGAGPRAQMINAELLQETEARFAEREVIRSERESKIREGAILQADDPDRVKKRVQHIARAAIETEGVGPSVPGQPPAQAVAAWNGSWGRAT
jgi:hypothetical protein